MRPTHASLQEAITIRKSPINGTGVFAITALPAGTLVGQFEGRQVEKPSRHTVNFGGRHIEPTEDFILKYLNHACSPNAEFKDVLLFTTAPIVG